MGFPKKLEGYFKTWGGSFDQLELLEQYYTNEGKCFTVLDKQSRRLGSLPHKKYIQELHRVAYQY